ncbi:hypothetical protein [Aureimonas mangrovi]|uniref:hypothetical protein n=1 Tax=Aureimonas mangrovi TaxID=2758041 RepID=UPI00163D900D|nr:hypothetical protein [Aureimonas mangrovi]
MWEWLAGIDLEKAANALVILITGILVAFGFRGGKQAPAPKEAAGSVEIAGALVDSSSVKLLAGEMHGHTLALTAQTAAMEAQTEELEEVRHALNRVRDSTDRLAMVKAMGR